MCAVGEGHEPVETLDNTPVEQRCRCGFEKLMYKVTPLKKSWKPRLNGGTDLGDNWIR